LQDNRKPVKNSQSRVLCLQKNFLKLLPKKLAKNLAFYACKIKKKTLAK
jgi:hypothetical protein